MNNSSGVHTAHCVYIYREISYLFSYSSVYLWTIDPIEHAAHCVYIYSEIFYLYSHLILYLWRRKKRKEKKKKIYILRIVVFLWTIDPIEHAAHCVYIYSYLIMSITFLVSRRSRWRPKDSRLCVRASVRPYVCHAVARKPFITFFWKFAVS